MYEYICRSRGPSRLGQTGVERETQTKSRACAARWRRLPFNTSDSDQINVLHTLCYTLYNNNILIII